MTDQQKSMLTQIINIKIQLLEEQKLAYSYELWSLQQNKNKNHLYPKENINMHHCRSTRSQTIR